MRETSNAAIHRICFTKPPRAHPRCSNGKRCRTASPKASPPRGIFVVAAIPEAPYVAETPKGTLRARPPLDTIAALENIAWWNWLVEKTTRHLKAIVSADLAALQAAAHDEMG